MTITRAKPKATPDAFIAGAPDAAAAGASLAVNRPPLHEAAKTERRRLIRGRKEQLTLTLAPSLVDQVDQAAGELGLSRTAWITQAIHKQLRAEKA